MTVKDGARRISKLMLALALACAMVPSAAYATDGGDKLPIDKVKETVEVGEGGELEGAEEPAMSTFAMERAATSAISLTVPILVTFGGSAGYDVSNPQPCVEAPTSFRNAGSGAVMITQIETDECSSGSVASVITEAGSDMSGNDTSLSNQTLYSLYPKGQPGKAVNMKHTGGTYKGGNVNVDGNVFGDTFVIGADSTLDCTYRLNLTNSYDVPNANAKVKSSAADGGKTVKPLSNVTYTVASYTPTGNGSARLGSSNGFYLTDTTTDQTYSAEDVKGHARDISKNGRNSLFYGMYAGFVYGYRPYTCKTYWSNSALSTNEVNTKVIGILHDDLSDGSGKAGLTFQTDVVAEDQMKASYTNIGGWGDASTELRTKMQPGGEIWDYMSADLQGAIATVDKAYGASCYSYSPDVEISEDKLFLASFYELEGNVDNRLEFQWLGKEGYQYEHYRQNDDLFIKSFNGVDTAWWLRTIYLDDTAQFQNVSSNGNVGMYDSPDRFLGVCPCFSL